MCCLAQRILLEAARVGTLVATATETQHISLMLLGSHEDALGDRVIVTGYLLVEHFVYFVDILSITCLLQHALQPLLHSTLVEGIVQLSSSNMSARIGAVIYDQFVAMAM